MRLITMKNSWMRNCKRVNTYQIVLLIKLVEIYKNMQAVLTKNWVAKYFTTIKWRIPGSRLSTKDVYSSFVGRNQIRLDFSKKKKEQHNNLYMGQY